MPPEPDEAVTPAGSNAPLGERDAAVLLDMLEAARIVVGYVTAKSFADSTREQMLRDAVERRVEIIGEAARGVSVPFRAAHPEIPWRPIMAQRNILAHAYATVRNDLLWTVATVHVPALIGLLETLIPPAPPEP